jgi:hypothetical protein
MTVPMIDAWASSVFSINMWWAGISFGAKAPLIN